MQRGYNLSPFTLDTTNECLWMGTEQIALSPKAFSVLLYLAERQGRLVTKQELLEAIWPDAFVTEGVLKRVILEIRKALDDSADQPRFIHTLHRRGYRLTSASAPSEVPVTATVEEPAQDFTAVHEPVPDNRAPTTEIVGRVQELLQLDEWFARALTASRQVIFISGEAGLGKSTLVDAWTRRSTLR